MPSSTTETRFPYAACRRRERSSGHRSSPLSVEAVPSVIESPNATTRSVSAGPLTSTASREYQDVGDGERLDPEDVGEAEAELLSPEIRPEDQAKRLVVRAHRRGPEGEGETGLRHGVPHRVRSVRRCSPGSDPLRFSIALLAGERSEADHG